MNEFAKIFRHDCTGVVMMLSNVYASELMTREQSDAVRAQLSTSLIPAETGEEFVVVVLRCRRNLIINDNRCENV